MHGHASMYVYVGIQINIGSIFLKASKSIRIRVYLELAYTLRVQVCRCGSMPVRVILGLGVF